MLRSLPTRTALTHFLLRADVTLMTQIASCSEAGVKFRRPLPLTVLCLVGWLVIAVAASRIAIHWPVIRTLPPAHVVGAPVAIAVSAVSLIGYWLMRRWGLGLILLGTLIRVAVSLAGTLPVRLVDLLWPGVIVSFGLVYFRRLR